MLAPESGVHISGCSQLNCHLVSYSFLQFLHGILSRPSIHYNLSRKENLQAVKLSSCMPSTPAVSLLHRSSQFNFAANIVHTINGPLETEETQTRIESTLNRASFRWNSLVIILVLTIPFWFLSYCVPKELLGIWNFWCVIFSFRHINIIHPVFCIPALETALLIPWTLRVWRHGSKAGSVTRTAQK